MENKNNSQVRKWISDDDISVTSDDTWLPHYAKDDIEANRCGVGYFIGQTFLFVPKAKYELIGRNKIHQYVECFFGEQRLENFGVWSVEYPRFYFMELPSVRRTPDDKLSIDGLIALVDKEYELLMSKKE